MVGTKENQIVNQFIENDHGDKQTATDFRPGDLILGKNNREYGIVIGRSLNEVIVDWNNIKNSHQLPSQIILVCKCCENYNCLTTRRILK